MHWGQDKLAAILQTTCLFDFLVYKSWFTDTYASLSHHVLNLIGQPNYHSSFPDAKYRQIQIFKYVQSLYYHCH